MSVEVRATVENEAAEAVERGDVDTLLAAMGVEDPARTCEDWRRVYDDELDEQVAGLLFDSWCVERIGRHEDAGKGEMMGALRVFAERRMKGGSA